MSTVTGGLSRLEATRRVMRALGTRGPNELDLAVDTDGRSAVIVCLPNEYVSEVTSRVERAGGIATVAVAFAKGYRIMTMGRSRSDGPVVEINEDLSMGMLLIRVDNNPGSTLRFRFRDVDASIPESSPELAYV